MTMFKEEKPVLQKLLEHNESRIAITTDMWTATNQKFCYVPCPHIEGVIVKVLMDCLSQYCLENKISTVVVDNATTNDAMMKILMDKFEKRSLMLKGDLLHLRCSAHILSLIVQDGLGVISSAIEKVRDCVSFWIPTPKRIENFEACRFLD
ncbi:zinc finger BED domain-containing protein RICESLEEPER 2-like [Amaranthus tricolor]|uniref:zinc finger BED domain-containing protein RICESLEEPER 2-like n=1 Tax=Amaranthus tricolor TaxID=29722 RepID=UPI00258F7C10|nr:zinc finger BED domain-containing protein RICESLEEPER 2-like [Amaranthus tricolor]